LTWCCSLGALAAICFEFLRFLISFWHLFDISFDLTFILTI
jgi:hypothetical protein